MCNILKQEPSLPVVFNTFSMQLLRCSKPGLKTDLPAYLLPGACALPAAMARVVAAAM